MYIPLYLTIFLTVKGKQTMTEELNISHYFFFWRYRKDSWIKYSIFQIERTPLWTDLQFLWSINMAMAIYECIWKPLNHLFLCWIFRLLLKPFVLMIHTFGYGAGNGVWFHWLLGLKAPFSTLLGIINYAIGNHLMYVFSMWY